MGCDIHMYVEHREPVQKQVYWRAFGGRINPGRDYELFGHLAGVRSDGNPVVAPRGIPDDLAYEAKGDWWLYITDQPSSGEKSCTPEAAARWREHQPELKVREHNGKPTWIEHPDWHTPSWATPDELEAALNQPSPWPHDAAYWALLAAMRELEKRGHVVRVVFWFDN